MSGGRTKHLEGPRAPCPHLLEVRIYCTISDLVWDDELESHLNGCTECQRVYDLHDAYDDRYLLDAPDCLERVRVPYYVSGSLPEEQRAFMERHIGSCEVCRTTVSDLNAFSRFRPLPQDPEY